MDMKINHIAATTDQKNKHSTCQPEQRTTDAYI